MQVSVSNRKVKLYFDRCLISSNTSKGTSTLNAMDIGRVSKLPSVVDLTFSNNIDPKIPH